MNSQIWNNAIPIYYQLALRLKKEITEGNFSVGDKFYSENELANVYELSRPTIRQAIASLVADGILGKERGRGTFVLSKNLFRQESPEKKYSGRIGVVMPWAAQTFFSPLLESIEDALYHNGMMMMMINNRDDANCEMARMRELLRHDIDGLLWVCPDKGSNMAFAAKISHELPVVAVDRINPALGKQVSLVESDHYNGMKMAVQYLYDKGSRSIAYLSSCSTVNTALLREEGFVAGMKQCNLPVTSDSIIHGRMDYFSNGVSGINKLLNGKVDFDGICCTSDDTARGALQVLKAKGIRVPDEVRVIGFSNDEQTCLAATPLLSSIHQDLEEMGKAAVKQLLTQINGNKELQHIVIPVKIVERESA